MSLTERYQRWNPSLATLREADISEHWSLWHLKRSLKFSGTSQQFWIPRDLLFNRCIRNMWAAISFCPTWPQAPSPMIKTLNAQITCLCYLLVPTAFISHSQTLAQQVPSQFRVHLDCSKIFICKSAQLQAHRNVFQLNVSLVCGSYLYDVFTQVSNCIKQLTRSANPWKFICFRKVNCFCFKMKQTETCATLTRKQNNPSASVWKSSAPKIPGFLTRSRLMWLPSDWRSCPGG